MANPYFEVLAHIRNTGNIVKGPGEFAGTRGRSLRMEGFSITFKPPVEGLGLRYRAHLTRRGTTAWYRDGEFVGTMGEGRAVEGFWIELTGPRFTEFDVFYMTHVERSGDTAYVSNGEFCGTQGRGLHTEGLAVVIVPRTPRHLSWICKAASADKKALVITAPQNTEQAPYAAIADGTDHQIWDRRPIWAAAGFVLISKTHPGYCLARRHGTTLMLRPVSVADTDNECAWVNTNPVGPHVSLKSFADHGLRIRLGGQAPFPDNGPLVLHAWENGQEQELWREQDESYCAAAGTDDASLNILAKAIYDGCRETVFRRTFPINRLGIREVTYDVQETPRIEIEQPATGAPDVTPKVKLSLEAVALTVVGTERTQVMARIVAESKIRLNPDRSLTLELTSGRLWTSSHSWLEPVLNDLFLPVLLEYLNDEVLHHIKIPPLELIGVRFAPPVIGTQYPHVLAATALPPDLSELPPDASRWPDGKVFLGVGETALNAVATAALDKLRPGGHWDWGPVNIGLCDLSLHAKYGVLLKNPRFTVTPTSGNTYKVHIELHGSAEFELDCAGAHEVGASATGSVTVTASISVDARNHVIVTIVSVDVPDLTWRFHGGPFWLDAVADLIFDAFRPEWQAIVRKLLHNHVFDVVAIPKINVTIAGKRFEITLAELALGSGQDGGLKPLVLATGTALVRTP